MSSRPSSSSAPPLLLGAGAEALGRRRVFLDGHERLDLHMRPRHAEASLHHAAADAHDAVLGVVRIVLDVLADVPPADNVERQVAAACSGGW